MIPFFTKNKPKLLKFKSWNIIISKLFSFHDVWLGLFIIGFSLSLLIYINFQPWSKIELKGMVGPATLPRLCGEINLIIGVLILLKAFSQLFFEKIVLPKSEKKIISVEFFIIIFAGITYILLIKTLGFLFITILLLGFLFWFWGEHNLIKNLFISIIYTILIYFFAIKVLMLDLP